MVNVVLRSESDSHPVVFVKGSIVDRPILRVHNIRTRILLPAPSNQIVSIPLVEDTNTRLER